MELYYVNQTNINIFESCIQCINYNYLNETLLINLSKYSKIKYYKDFAKKKNNYKPNKEKKCENCFEVFYVNINYYLNQIIKYFN